MMLFLLGVGLHCVYSGRIVWELWNVLTQLSFTVIVTFLLMRLSRRGQFVGALVCLILTEFLYRLYDPTSPFVKDANFGSWMDMMLMGKLNDGGGWVTINCLPTAAHTIWGAICGQLLLSEGKSTDKLYKGHKELDQILCDCRDELHIYLSFWRNYRCTVVRWICKSIYLQHIWIPRTRRTKPSGDQCIFCFRTDVEFVLFLVSERNLF